MYIYIILGHQRPHEKQQQLPSHLATNHNNKMSQLIISRQIWQMQIWALHYHRQPEHVVAAGVQRLSDVLPHRP